MKYLISLFIFIFGITTVTSLMAQNIQIIMSPKPSPYLSDWQQQNETVKLVITNTSGKDISVKIKTEIFASSGAVVASTDASKMPIMTISSGTNIYNAEDIIPESAVNFKGNIDRTTVQTGRIPDDNYRICIALTDPATGVVIGTSGTVCQQFAITAYQAPTLIAPANEIQIPENGIKGILFRWTPLVPKPRDVVTYRLQVWEVLDGQSSMIAIRTNQPIVTKDINNILQTQWPVDFAMPEVGNNYVWTIIPLDNQGRKIIDGNGFSEPNTFQIISDARRFTVPEGKSPEKGAIVSASDASNITFRWTPLVPKPQELVTYRLKVWQLMQGQNGTQAMRSNPPIVTKDCDNITEIIISNDIYTGPCRPPYLCEFIWQVQALDRNGNAIGDNNGVGEPSQFSVQETTGSKSLSGVAPASNVKISAADAKSITFRWTPIVPKPQEPVTYRLKVWQLMQGQNGTQAMRSNPPIVTKDCDNITEIIISNDIYTGPCRPPYLCEFIWQVQALDRNGNSIGENNGMGEPSQFSVSETSGSKSLSGIAPASNAKISAADAKSITFRWTPVVPKPQEPVTYRLKVWQLMQGQNGTQAMRSNQPIVTKDCDNITEIIISNDIYTGPCRPPYLCEFIWQVQALDKNGNAFGENNGVGEPSQFSVSETSGSKSLSGIAPASNAKISAADAKSITFRWTPIVPKPQEPVTYRLKVWQLMQGQNGTQAMRSNPPIVTKDCDNITEIIISNDIYTGPCRPPYLCEFIWQVQALDRNGNAIGENNGMGESSQFSVQEITNAKSLSGIAPASNAKISAADAKSITFRWTLIVPKPLEPVTYRLKVWQLMQGQNGTQAMRSNPPIVTKDCDNITEIIISNDIYTGPCRPPYLCEFIWQVQALDKNGNAIGENNGVGEPSQFSVQEITDAKSLSGIAPVSNAKISAADAKSITFRWTPIVPKPQEPVTYRLKVWQLMQGQNATQAMRSNPPIVTKDCDNITEIIISNDIYTGPCRPPYLCEFIWQVQALDRNGNVIGNADSSQYSNFEVIEVK